LYGDSQSEKVLALYDQALPRLVAANQSKTGADSRLGGASFDFAEFYAKQGNAEKCWEAFQIAMENDPGGHLAKRAKRVPGRFSVISDRPAFKAFTEAAPETELDRWEAEMDRKRAEFSKEMSAAWESFLPVEVDGVMFMGVILSVTGHVLVPDIVADATNIRAKLTDYLPAKVIARDSEAKLAVLKVEGAKYLRPVEMGTVDDLKEYAPFDYASTNGRTGRTFPSISQMTARGFGENPRVGRITRSGAGVHTLEIGKAGNVSSLLIGKRGKRSPLSDAFIHYDGSLLGFCVDEEVVYKENITHNAPGPKHNVVPIDQIQASLERMDLRKK
jgi:hypothetical protein